MSAPAELFASRLLPVVRYRDIAAAIDWLCAAFGFAAHSVATAVDGSILHAQLTFGDDMIMLLPMRGAELDKPPKDAGAAMQSCYFAVDDADLHHRTAKAAGAEILDIKQYDLGGRGYCCRDPEGHVWNFGTHNPRQASTLRFGKPRHDPWVGKPRYGKRKPTWLPLPWASLRDKLNPPVIVAASVAVVVSAATVGWILVALPQPGTGAKDRALAHMERRQAMEEAAPSPREPTQVRTLTFGAIAASQRPMQADERAARRSGEPASEPGAKEAPALAATQRSAPEPAENAKDAAERAAQEALRQWRAAHQTLRQLAREQSLKEDAERAAAREDEKRAAAREDEKHAAAEAGKAPASALDTGDDVARVRAPRDTPKRTAKKNHTPPPEAGLRAGVTAIAPASNAGQPTERNAREQIWDCLPRPPSGQVVCRPQEKQAPTRLPMEPAAESAKPAAQPKDLRQSMEQNGGEQSWDCQPRPPSGQVVCVPTVAPIVAPIVSGNR